MESDTFSRRTVPLIRRLWVRRCAGNSASGPVTISGNPR